MNDLVNHPPHYGGEDSPYETIKVIEVWKLGFHLGNAVKYISRAGRKGGPLEDLRKARWYLDREIARLERAQLVGNYQVPLDSSPGENSLADADRALAAELAADPAILASLAEWERTSGPPARENSPADPIDWKRVARALLDSANAAQDGDGYQVAAELRATWVHYVGDANAE